MPLITNEIESELSYAYLHAVCSKAGFNCKIGNRHDDNMGIDAEITYKGPINHPYIRQVQFNVQLKATKKKSGNYPDHHSYFFKGQKQFEALRTNDSLNYKLLIVLFLDELDTNWLSCTDAELVLKKSAYWVNLYGAPASINDGGETVYLPKAHLLTPDELIRIVELAAHQKLPSYSKPA